ncbi:MAG: hypothetical protein AB7N24_03205 [Dehalococcoidia bacterium]
MAFLKGIGLREAVALGVLVIGLILAAVYFNPKSTNNSVDPRTPEASTLTPVETTWRVTWIEGDDFEHGVVVGQGEQPEIDFDYPAGPYPDVKDDNWGLVATTTIENSEGRNLLYLSYKGGVGLTIDGEDRGITPSPGDGKIIVPFQQEAGATTQIVLRLRDAGGETRLSAEIRK